MASSAFVRRRWISAIFRSNRKMSSGGAGVGSRSPLLMVGPGLDAECGLIYRSWCCAENRIYTFFDNKHKRRGGESSIDYLDAVDDGHMMVGSSQGRLAYQTERDLYLVDPTTYRRTNLPPPPTEKEVHSVVLDSATHKAFMISGSGRGLGFCWAGRSSEWTLLSDDEAYESVVYSSIHRRLLCLTSSMKLEAWDVAAHFPRLDRVTELRGGNVERGGGGSTYIACAERSGQVFVVVRQAKRNEVTVGFVVYKIELESEAEAEMVRMEDSLEGMSMFVGMNDAVVINEDEVVGGVQPNCIYHTFQNSLRVGVFDYRKGNIFALSRPDTLYCKNPPLEPPLWFTPKSPISTT